MIRVAYLDDHPATRAGLEAILNPPKDLVPVGGAASEHELWALLRHTHPDVLLLDYRHPGSDGLSLCRQVIAVALSPYVIIYTSDASPMMTVASALAGAAAIVSKAAPQQQLLETIRRVARDEHRSPPPPASVRRAAAERLDPSDHAILAMRTAGTPLAQVAATLDLDVRKLGRRTDAIIARLLAGDDRAPLRTVRAS